MLDSTKKSAGKTTPINFHVKTFGCQMNEYDSEKISTLLSRDYHRVDSIDAANVVIVNTCSVRELGEQKLFSLLGSLRDRKKDEPSLVVGVSGCVAQQEGQEIFKRMPSVDFVVGTHNLSLVPALVDQARRGRRHQVAIDYRDEWEELPLDLEKLGSGEKDVSPSQELSACRALIAIQRGCNKKCSFCVVPNTRGPEVSREIGEILREVRAKVSRGAKEVLLLGQTVNSWGKDCKPRQKFSHLVEEIAQIAGVQRIRFISPHPAEVRDDFLELYGRIPQLCPHIHLPLQSGSDRILKLMNRNYHRERYREIVRAVRERVPGIAITTDIIVGFPSESASDFSQTLELVSEIRYNSLFAFKYSRRPGTAAAEFLSPQEIPASEADRRLAELFAIQEKISAEENSLYLGKVVDALVEAPGKRLPFHMRGRIAENVAIDIENGAPNIGDIVPVLVEHAGSHGLRGRLLENEQKCA